ncbi:MAG: hypothetical protein ACKOFT_11230 [Actinomycetota bacterium]
MPDSITCVCGYRGPAGFDGSQAVCPICRTAATAGSGPFAAPPPPGSPPPVSRAGNAAGVARDTSNDSDGFVAAAPSARKVYRIPCPNNHILKAKESMLGKQVVCPECNEFFVLELRNSLEQRKEDARRRAEREEELAKLWLKRAIWAAAIIVLSFIVMVVLSLWPELIYPKKD